MELGTLLPWGDIGGDPAVVREYAQTAEAIGYDFVEAPDHVLGVNAASRPGWDRNISKDLFHDPFVLFGYLAGCTQKLGFSTGVLILPQRQTVLVAKQAACLDVLCGRPLPARHRGRLERGRVHRPEREFPQSRPPLRGAGAGHAEIVGRAARHFQGPLAHDRGRRHQPAACIGQGAGVVRRPSRPHLGAHRQMGRRLDAERLYARPRGARRASADCAI